MKPGYRIEVFWSDEDEVWLADVPDLPMCSAHGPAPHEAVAEVEQAIEALLGGLGNDEWLAERHRPDWPSSRRLSI